MERNGADVTGAFSVRDGALVGLVDGLRVGGNELSVEHKRRGGGLRAHLQLSDHRADVLRAAADAVRVQDDQGARRSASRSSTTSPATASACSPRRLHRGLEPRLQRAHGRRLPLPHDGRGVEAAARDGAPGRRRDDDALDGRDRRLHRPPRARDDQPLPLLLRDARARRRGRPIDTSLWNRRLVYTFDGGVAIGHSQGTLGGSAVDPDLLRLGYAIVHSSGTRTSVHYNLQLGGETALMTKERFVERYGVPRYTVGVGGSGGAIQQYVYGQNHPGLLDAGIPRTPIPTWSRRRSTSATASCSSTTWTSPTARTRSGATGTTASG